MADRPGREAAQPYIDHHASIAGSAKALRMSLDMTRATTEVNTHQLALILDTMIGAGFRGQGSEQFQADIAAAHAAALAAQSERAAHGDGEE